MLSIIKLKGIVGEMIRVDFYTFFHLLTRRSVCDALWRMHYAIYNVLDCKIIHQKCQVTV